jgi:hypothetical protein
MTLNSTYDPFTSPTTSEITDGSQSTTDSAVAILGNAMYRMHRFRSTASPIKGLTADILVRKIYILWNLNQLSW